MTDPMDYFLLDAVTGELRTAKPLDKEALEDSTGVLTLIIRVLCYAYISFPENLKLFINSRPENWSMVTKEMILLQWQQQKPLLQ